jgi:hypothetical protein
LLRSFRRFLPLKKVLKFAKSCKNTIYLLICKKYSLFRCRHLSSDSSNQSQQQILNLTSHAVFAIHVSPPHILRSVKMTTHSTPLATHARDHWWTLDFAYNASISPDVNSRAELVPSPRAYARNRAWRRWLGDNWTRLIKLIYFLTSKITK